MASMAVVAVTVRHRALRRLGYAATAAATAFLLAGCVPAALAPHSSSRSGSLPPSKTAPGSPLKDGLTWSSGLTVRTDADGGYFPAFVNPLAGDTANWTVIPSATDVTGGKGAYRSATSSCTLRVFQGTASDVTMVPGDDRASTLAVLGAAYGPSFADVQDKVVEAPLSYGIDGAVRPGEPIVDGLALVQTSDTNGGSILWARAFSSIEETAMLGATCDAVADLPVAFGAISRFGMVGS